MLVGSLNILGDAYNPLEFMDNSESNDTFECNYAKIRSSFMELTSDEVEKELCDFGIESDQIKLHLKYSSFYKNCTESFLERDNKLSLLNRTNLIVCATKPLDDGTPLFRAAGEWRSLILCQREHYLASGVDIPILLWDIACCLAIEKNLPEYVSVCEKSHLNPENLVLNAERLLKPISAHAEVIVAIQEFPKDGSANRAALFKVIKELGMKSLEMGDVGFLYSEAITPIQVVDSPLGTEPRDIVAAVQQQLSALPPLDLSGDELKRLRTTARKTLVMDVGTDLRIVAIHVKEFKTESGTAFLARYLRGACDATRMNIIVGDTNIPTAAKAAVFISSAAECGLHVLSPVGCITTRKRRSELHGQCYDTAKCLRVVEAHKDFVLAMGPPGGCGGWELGEAAAHPDLVQEAWRLLPSADWPSDHCMVRLELRRSPLATP